MIETSVTDGIATVELARPEKKNALTFEMFDALAQTAADLANTQGLRAVVITGQGGAFSAGLDLGAMQAIATKLDAAKADLMDRDSTGANRYQRPVTSWAQVPVPVIAAVDGVCLGAGFQLALGADFRIAHPDAKFSVMESRWGLVADMGISQSLPKLLRADQAKMLMMSAKTLLASEAADMGLVTELHDDPKARALELAQSFAAKSPNALAAAKSLVDQGWAGGTAALALEADLQRDLMGSPNQIEAVMANLQKRSPKFR